MESFYQFFELFATFVEGAIAVSVSTSLADRKLGVKKNTLYVFFYVNNIHNTHNTLE